MEIKKSKVSFFEKIGYSSGDFASNLFWQTFMFFLPIFYTDVFGLPMAAAAWLFGVSRILDAITDPAIGMLADRTKSRWGRFRPYILFGAIPFGVIGILSFTTPDMSITGKIVYAFITYNLMMILYTVVNIPYSSLLGVLTPNSQERTKISSMRFIFAFSAGLFVTAFNNSFVESFGDLGSVQVISKTDLVEREAKEATFNTVEFGGKVAFVDKTVEIEQVRIKKIADEGVVVMVGDYLGKKEEDIKIDTIPSIAINRLVRICEIHESGEAEDLIALGSKYFVVDKYTDNNTYYDGKIKNSGAFILVDASHLAGFENGKDAKLVSQAKGYKYTISLYAILSILLLLFTFSSTKERVVPQKEETNKIGDDLKDLIKNKPWLILLGAGIFTLLYVSMRNGAIAYYFKYYVSVDTIFGYDVASAFMVLGTLASIAGTGAVAYMARLMGKKNAYITLMLLSTLFTGSFYFIGDDQVGLMMTFQLLASLFMGPTTALVWAMYADVADYSEWKTGRRATGLIFSASTMAQKVGWAIGGVITMVVLGMVGYDANAIEQSPAAITGIKSLMALLPASVSILCAGLVFFYTLDDKTVEKMQGELAARGAKKD